MKILLTGATGYIGKRMLPVLLEEGHEVVCCVRDLQRFDIASYKNPNISAVEVDFLDAGTLINIPEDIDAAFFLIHSMAVEKADFSELEALAAENFKQRMSETKAKQVIYLSGIINEKELSKHLDSRKQVEIILGQGSYALTTLRAGIIVGSGSASFEIIRDLVEKLPFMITPRWLNTKSQPIAVRNVIDYLKNVLFDERNYNQSFDIGGPEVLTYKEMLLQFARVRKLKRRIVTLPIMTPRLSSYWLYFVTSTSYRLAVNLVDSMKIEIICRPSKINDYYQLNLIPYEQAVQLAFDKIAQQEIVSSWTDALSSKVLEDGISNHINVPNNGCFIDERSQAVSNEEETLKKVIGIGGEKGWYFGNWLWEFRGFVDKMFGGVGLRRGRRSMNELINGDALDFWRVLFVSKKEKRLLLFAEMKLPGEAWLEFRIKDNKLYQTATFRPRGLWGRLYWYAIFPLHGIVFNGMIKKIAQ